MSNSPSNGWWNNILWVLWITWQPLNQHTPFFKSLTHHWMLTWKSFKSIYNCLIHYQFKTLKKANIPMHTYLFWLLSSTQSITHDITRWRLEYWCFIQNVVYNLFRHCLQSSETCLLSSEGYGSVILCKTLFTSGWDYGHYNVVPHDIFTFVSINNRWRKVNITS